MTENKTHMAKEIAEIPFMIERQLNDGLGQYLEVGKEFSSSKPSGFITCARGTSDHAATFFKYMIETQTGLPVASIGPSVASVYNTALQLEGFASIAFSQSGGSPDLTKLQTAAKLGGAKTASVLNVVDSPLGDASDIVLPVYARPENAVAATKSFVGMLVASLGFMAGFTGNKTLESDLKDLPDLARETLGINWGVATVPVANARSLFCVGRGLEYAIAAEAALKFKETCRLHAEAYSAAELLHGPVAIAGSHLTAILFSSNTAASESIDTASNKLKQYGATVFKIDSKPQAQVLDVPHSGNELLNPILQAIAFYSFVEDLSVRLGQNPDAPAGLRKVTETV